MSGPGGSINPRNNAFAGGSITRASPPTGASGSFSSVGAPGFPNPGIPAIASARNNRGSNICVPYARVVPLHSRDALVVYDDRITMTGQKVVHEYDGIEAGELAWVMGKQYSYNSGKYAPQIQFAGMASMPLTYNGAGPAVDAEKEQFMMDRMGPGVGFGVDRLQRLAYTNWIESHFVMRIGRQVIDLCEDVTSEQNLTLSSALKYWSDRDLVSNNMFAMPDIAYALQTTTSNDARQVDTPMAQGLFVMERGPFLRSIGTNHRPVQIEAVVEGDKGIDVKRCEVNRHLGSDLAQSALEVVLRKSGVFNWTPDGICMSKYETGPDGIADAQFDAKMSQLFNVAVQGSAITKTWTGDNKLICMPTDRVFILVVGDLSYSTSTVDTDMPMSVAAAKKTKALSVLFGVNNKKKKAASAKEWQAYETAMGKKLSESAKPSTPPTNAIANETAFESWIGRQGGVWPPAQLSKTDPSQITPGAGIRDGIMGYEQARAEGKNVAKYKARAEYLWSKFKETTGGSSDPLNNPLNYMLSDFDKDAAELRNGTRWVTSAQLTNLRLMRATSSYLVQNSHYRDQSKNKSPDARLGLSIHYDKAAKNGIASYILGGWCIGSVLDSAASRTMMGSVVRVAANSMAMNINVNVEWWNSDRLYQCYQDRERYIKSTSVLEPDATAAAAALTPKETISSAIDVERHSLAADAGRAAPAPTLHQRDMHSEGPSRRFSLDLDAESFDEKKDYGAAPDIKADGREFSRIWWTAEASPTAPAATAPAAAATKVP